MSTAGRWRASPERRATQMPEDEEGLYAELADDRLGGVGPAARRRDVAADRAACTFPDGRAEHLPMPAVRGLAADADPAVRRAAYDAEVAGWPAVAVRARRR